MPFSQSLAIVPQDAVACGRLYFIGQSSRFRRSGCRGVAVHQRLDLAGHLAQGVRREQGFSIWEKCLIVPAETSSFEWGTETMIAVVGATGNTGRAVVKELKALGQDPVCVVRNVDKAREVLGDVRTAVAELT